MHARRLGIPAQVHVVARLPAHADPVPLQLEQALGPVHVAIEQERAPAPLGRELLGELGGGEVAAIEGHASADHPEPAATGGERVGVDQRDRVPFVLPLQADRARVLARAGQLEHPAARVGIGYGDPREPS